jgi:myo-inositol-1(or 4)-monophosphatase
MDEFTIVCEHAAKTAGKVLSELLGRVTSTEKGRHDLVTEADLASQRVVAEILRSAFPEHRIVGEEDTCHVEQRMEAVSVFPSYTWLVDPLDGTTNYVHGFPHFCVSLALVRHTEQAAELVTGTIYDPCRDERFTAVAGLGAFLNGSPLRVSGATSLARGLLACSLPPVVDPDMSEVQTMVRAMAAARSVRRTGSAALNLAYLAAGRLDGYWATSLNAWDVAAGALLVQEAGGVIKNLDGGTLDVFAPQFVAAATPELHAELSALVGPLKQ